MRGLSLTQPHASLVAISAKKIETRSWGTQYRGLVAIHASKVFPYDCRRLCFQEPFFTPLHTAGLADITADKTIGVERLPRGAIVAVALLIDCCSTNAWSDGPGLAGWVNMLSETERAFGDYSAHRYGLLLAGVRRLPQPIPCRGALGLWTVSPALVAEINAQLLPAEVQRCL